MMSVISFYNNGRNMPDFNKVMVHSETGKYMLNIIIHLMSAIDASDLQTNAKLREIMSKGDKIIKFSNITTVDRSNY